MRQNEVNFSSDQNVEFKKSFELYCQTLIRVKMKVAKILIHYAWHGRKWNKIWQIFNKNFKSV
jgi:hypothetical protein